MNIKLLNTSLLLCSLVCFNNLHAQTDDLLASISDDMEHYTKVATTTKLNESYQPYIISVFNGKDLEKLGIVNLEEALGLVPGVDMATDNMGIKTPIFRGSNPTAFGQSKLFIDGVLANNLFFDAYSEHLKMPIEMIKRIEVIRGPGSKTDGYNAYAGSINVITYAETIEGIDNGDAVILKGGSYKYGMIGFVKSYKMGNFTLSTDFSYQKDDKTAYAGPDGMSQGVMSVDGDGDGDYTTPVYDYDNREFSKTGDAYLWFKSYALGATLKYKNKFYVKLRLLEHTQASGYGINFTLAAEKKDRLKTRNHYLEFGYKEEMDAFVVSLNTGVKYDSFDSKAHLVNGGFSFFDLYKYNTTDHSFEVYTDSITKEDSTYGIHKAEQRTLYQSTFIRYNGFAQHSIKLGYRLTQEKTISMVSKLSDWGSTESTLVDYTDTFAFFDKDASRDTQAFFFEDSYSFRNNLNFLFGFTYEHTSYEDADFEPQASMVYQANMNHIFKLLYSQSHRNPSWQEMYTQNNHARVGSTDFKPERVEAFEAAYIYKINSLSHLQSNIFYLKNSDQIQIVDSKNGIFDNTGESTIYGLELEYKGNFGSNDSLYMNYSYIDGEENDSHELSNVAHHMIKGYYSYDINNAISTSTIVEYVGKKHRLPSDTRDTLKGYSKIDLTLRYHNAKYNYTVVGSVKNLFDSDIRFPSQPNTYVEDYIQEGRNYILTLKKKF